ncbi:MAG: hypothetical protein LBH26_08685, partial [Treponema sp.]|nr:hypothetical protein [Treponema sp.]
MGTVPSRGRWGDEFSLYIHVPFCRSFCDYCDFYSVLLKDEQAPGSLPPSAALINAYIDTLLADGEILFRDFPGCRVPTVYIGGGDPSILGA